MAISAVGVVASITSTSFIVESDGREERAEAEAKAEAEAEAEAEKEQSK